MIRYIKAKIMQKLNSAMNEEFDMLEDDPKQKTQGTTSRDKVLGTVSRCVSEDLKGYISFTENFKGCTSFTEKIKEYTSFTEYMYYILNLFNL
jgi:hypothetical protein